MDVFGKALVNPLVSIEGLVHVEGALVGLTADAALFLLVIEGLTILRPTIPAKGTLHPNKLHTSH